MLVDKHMSFGALMSPRGSALLEWRKVLRGSARSHSGWYAASCCGCQLFEVSFIRKVRLFDSCLVDVPDSVSEQLLSVLRFDVPLLVIGIPAIPAISVL
jgi:hypothetical protein